MFTLLVFSQEYTVRERERERERGRGSVSTFGVSDHIVQRLVDEDVLVPAALVLVVDGAEAVGGGHTVPVVVVPGVPHDQLVVPHPVPPKTQTRVHTILSTR